MIYSHLRMLCPVEEAMARYGCWIGAPELGPELVVVENGRLVRQFLEDEQDPSQTWTSGGCPRKQGSPLGIGST
jgi:hypothetical protein